MGELVHCCGRGCVAQVPQSLPNGHGICEACLSKMEKAAKKKGLTGGRSELLEYLSGQLAEVTEPLSYEEARALIPTLTDAQKQTLSAICCGEDFGHHPKIIESLVRLRLIGVASEEMQYGPGKSVLDRIPVKVTRYGYTIPIHMAWCEWACAEPTKPLEQVRREISGKE